MTIEPSDTFIELVVERSGNLQWPLTANYATVDSRGGGGVEETEGTVSFSVNQKTQFIRVDLLESDKVM